ncbi:CYTH domain-containing protein [Cellulophaga baltica]|uniref:Adenylate cyclase n=1 Tax=Cellulophaga baltica 18 TaxID=1348584 RepID=A0AAU8RA19_9FLAO|nr:CYTH domain-containing protein [Cellulophaga baltica]AIZ40812.1 adenylate cyclase [Cellulophaga baltica 18]WFO15212.1 CYTH domain-containing protein [Cellulophaga baltica 4]
MVEIERKFLVLSDAYKQEASAKIRIVQGFLNTDPERTVRVRIKGEQGFLTIKGKGNDTGVSRFEWEKEIAISEAEALLKIVEPGGIEKFRYEVQVGNHTFEVDEFFGENEGLIVAEVELNSENEAFKKPVWLGEEVSGIIKYYNSQLSKHPYKSWETR